VPTIPETERHGLVLTRRGRGQFRANVLTIERACRVTKAERPDHLIASHTKPWRDSSNEQRVRSSKLLRHIRSDMSDLLIVTISASQFLNVLNVGCLGN
jgi:hypothetical protein